MSRYEIRLAGEGGQGILLAGLILAEAVALYQDKEVVMTQSYASQQRGGPSCTEIIVSEEKIDYPKVLEADLLVALNQDSFDCYWHQVKSGGIVLVESAHKKTAKVDHVTVEHLPLREVSREITRSEKSANIVALGIISALTEVASSRALLTSMKGRLPPGSQEANEQAFEAGQRIGEEVRREWGRV